MDPKILADLDTKVAYHPQLRSMLVVCHGDLVYERYWHGDAQTGQFAVTVQQLLTMSSGLASDDPSLGGDPGLMDRLHQSRDWVRHIFGRNLVTSPGASFAYSSASSHLLSAIVADATGQSTLAFARSRLFAPTRDPHRAGPAAGQVGLVQKADAADARGDRADG
jgi:CubicO group peptidase (beta-lactamase class C family)